MKIRAHKIGAIFFVLWGVVHIVGGGALLQTQAASGITGVLASTATAVPVGELPQIPAGIVSVILAFHSWNLLWIGALVLGIGVTLNWRNSRAGYWINMVLVGGADLGLIVGLLIPGYMTFSDGLWGPLLWILAAIFGGIGLLNQERRPLDQAAFA